MDERGRLADAADTLLKAFVSYGLVRSIKSPGFFTPDVSAQFQILTASQNGGNAEE